MTDFYVFNFFPVMLVEAAVLRLCRWGSFPRCLLDSLLANFVSFIALMLGFAPDINSAKIFGLSLFFTYSFLVETVVLCLLERATFKRTCIAAAIANFVGVIYLAIDAFCNLR